MSLTFTSFVDTQDGNKVALKRKSLVRKRSWVRVLEQELLDTLAEVFKAVFNLSLLVARCNINGIGALVDVVVSSEFLSNALDGLLHVGRVITGVGEEMVFSNKALKGSVLAVHMLGGIIDSILSNVLTWELEAIVVSSVERHSIVDVVHLLKGKLLEVSNEPGEEMSLRHCQGGVLVVF